MKYHMGYVLRRKKLEGRRGKKIMFAECRPKTLGKELGLLSQ